MPSVYPLGYLCDAAQGATVTALCHDAGAKPQEVEYADHR